MLALEPLLHALSSYYRTAPSHRLTPQNVKTRAVVSDVMAEDYDQATEHIVLDIPLHLANGTDIEHAVYLSDVLVNVANVIRASLVNCWELERREGHLVRSLGFHLVRYHFVLIVFSTFGVVGLGYRQVVTSIKDATPTSRCYSG